MEKSLTILYTANIHGDLEILPRLHTLIRQLKTQPIVEEDEVMLCAVEPLARRTLLLDLGDSCAPDVWHCAETEGRSTLLVLDAMGYHAANVSGLLTPESRAKLDSNFLKIALVDEFHPWNERGIFVSAKAGDRADALYDLRIVLSPQEKTRLNGHTLHLAMVNAVQVGMVQVGSRDGNGSLALYAHEIFTMNMNALPDPTIAATVEYVLSEARYHQKRKDSNP
jgi:hypothetical protein